MSKKKKSQALEEPPLASNAVRRPDQVYFTRLDGTSMLVAGHRRSTAKRIMALRRKAKITAGQ